MEKELRKKMHLMFLDEKFTDNLFGQLENMIENDYLLKEEGNLESDNTREEVPIDEFAEMTMKAIFKLMDMTGDTAIALLLSIEGVSRANIATNKKLDTVVKALNESTMDKEKVEQLQEKLDSIDDEVRKISKHDEILTWIQNYVKRAERKYD